MLTRPETLPSELRDFVADAVDVGQDRRDPLRQRLARGGQRHAAGGAIEQLLAQRLFQFAICMLRAG